MSYDRVIDVMKICGLAPEHYARFPHQFSGGQRQRIGRPGADPQPDTSSPMNPSRPLMCVDSGADHRICFSILRDSHGVTFSVYLPRPRGGGAFM
ncbi:hypothetical protein MJ561_16760 [Klebsiella pneumoniae]|nr:hypothetical protein MJ561_16760 [Klebsiella pneumoniae]